MEKTTLTNLYHKGRIPGRTVNTIRRQTTVLLFLTAFIGICNSLVIAKPLKVYILAGQSNMVGAAKIATFDYIGDDPKTLEMLNEMRDSNGKPRTVKDTWISYYQSHESGDPSGEGFGQLTAGYGGRKNPTKSGDNIGPELTFGIFELNETEIEKIKQSGGDLEAERAKRKEKSGAYYRLMMDHVKHVLKDVKRVCPIYDERQGHEIAGFVWFQGWNDLVNRGVYPNRGQKGGYDKYSELMAMFIRDVRKDLKTPEMPFVIGGA
jgi:hypothetical protein